MKENKNIARLVGILFIVGTVSGILSAVFASSFLTDPEYLTKISVNPTPMNKKVSNCFII